MLSLLNTTFTNAVRQGFSLVSSLLNKLKKRVADDGGTFENEACTKAELEKLNDKGLLKKVTVLTTPTAYNFRKLYSIKPEGLGSELVTNGDFATDLNGWVLQNVDASNTITWEPNGARVISVGVNISLRQLGILEVGKTYKLTCNLSITSGRLGIDGATAGSTINMVEGFNEITFTAFDTRLIIKRITGNDNCLIDNISVKEVLNADFEFDRGSLGTRVDEQGYIDTSLANAQPRIDYLKGCGSFLLEPSRTNYQPRSEDFGDGTWTKTRGTIVSNSNTAPDGLFTADEFGGTSGTTHYIYDGKNATATGKYTISVFAKYLDVEEFKIVNFQQNGEAKFNIKDGYIVSNSGTYTNPKIEDYGNGWYRCSALFTATATGSVNYGFFLSNAINKSIYLWGAQFEVGGYPTTYIPALSGASVTRNAEAATDAGSSTLFNVSEGVLMAEISALALIGGDSRISLSDKTLSNRVSFAYSPTASKAYIIVKLNSTTIINNLNVEIGNHLDTKKIAISYKSGDTKVYLNGAELLTSSASFTGGVLNDLSFESANSSVPFYGNTKQIQYYDSALNSEDLEKLTSWVSFQDMAQGQSYTIE